MHSYVPSDFPLTTTETRAMTRATMAIAATALMNVRARSNVVLRRHQLGFLQRDKKKKELVYEYDKRGCNYYQEQNQ